MSMSFDEWKIIVSVITGIITGGLVMILVPDVEIKKLGFDLAITAMGVGGLGVGGSVLNAIHERSTQAKLDMHTAALNANPPGK
jgi:hypothetical protein